MQKSKWFVLLLVLVSVSSVAQENENKRFVEVNGEAKIEVIPDEIYVSATIREEKPESFDKVEKAFLSAMKKFDLLDEDISLADMTGEFASAWFKKDQLRKEKIYQIKLSSAESVGDFLKMADEVGLKDVNIVRTDISNRDEVERNLRIAAVKDSKEKATYMTAALDSKIGDVLLIRDQYMNIFRGNERVNDMAMMQMSASYQKMEKDVVVGFKKIRMEIKVFVRYEIL